MYARLPLPFNLTMSLSVAFVEQRCHNATLKLQLPQSVLIHSYTQGLFNRQLVKHSDTDGLSMDTVQNVVRTIYKTYALPWLVIIIYNNLVVFGSIWSAIPQQWIYYTIGHTIGHTVVWKQKMFCSLIKKTK